MILTIDPGTQYCGWALGTGWSNELKKYGLIQETKGGWLRRSKSIVKQIVVLIRHSQAKHVIIELPRSWDSGKGIGAKAQGSILKLSCMVGMLVGRLLTMRVQIGFLEAGKWQGQLPKSVIRERVIRQYKLKPHTLPAKEKWYNVTDAVGLYSATFTEKVKWLI